MRRSPRLLIGGPLLALALLAISGCQPGWVRVDGGEADRAALQQARSACRVEEKLAALEQARAANYDAAAGAGSSEGRMLQIATFEEENYRTYRRLNACMREQGLRKAR